jgi:hypothetical protein
MSDITSPAVHARKASTLTLRKVLGTLHLWVGIIFSIPFAAIGITGSLWMLVRDLPAEIQPYTGPAHSIREYVEAA